MTAAMTAAMTSAATHVSTARLALPAGTALPALRAAAAQLDLPAAQEGEALILTLPRARLRAAPEGAGVALTVSAPDAVGLQLGVDALAERFSALGLRLDWDSAPKAARPANFSLAHVAGVEQISPSYARVTLEGPDLARFGAGGHHFRLLFGPEGADWPATGPGGVTQWPGGAAAWRRPVYTTRALTPGADGAARLDFDVFLHEGGRVADWARRAAPGDQIALTGPGGGGALAPCGWVGMVCDETAVPAAARMLEALPADTRGEAALIVADPDDAQALSHPPGVVVTWLARGDGAMPLAALQALAPPPQDRFVFFAAERREAEQARAHFNAVGLARTEARAAAYWTRGEPGSD